MIISLGASPKFQDILKQNVMYYIARDGKTLLFDYFRKLNLPVSDADLHGQTPLFYAAREGRLELCRKLLEAGVNPNHVDENKQTALFYAAKYGRLNICQLLINEGCNPNIKDFRKETAIVYAKKEGHEHIIKFLNSLKASNKVQREKSASSDTKAAAPQIKKKQPPKEKEKEKTKEKEKEQEEPKATYKLVFLPDPANTSNAIDVSDQEFQVFRQQFPELAEYLTNPWKIPINQLEKKKEGWENVAKKILTTLWKMPGAHVFYEPVDPIRFGCVDYFQIIHHPMDFGTIKVKDFEISKQ